MKIIVLGATGTIGKAVSDALATRHVVVRASRRSEMRVDVNDRASIEGLFDAVGSVDAVVNCAGDVSGAFGPLDKLGDEAFQAAAAIAPSAEATMLCNDEATAVTQCGATLDQAACLNSAKVYSDPTLANADACTTQTCSQIAGCVSAALGQPAGTSSPPVCNLPSDT